MTSTESEGGAPRTLHAFISYASPDRERALEICDSLEARGLRCWIAPRDLPPGVEYGEGIVDGIRRCRCLVLVLSEAANASPMVRREVERAVSTDKPVFPVRVEEVLPAKSLEFFVSATHWIDAWQGVFLDHIEALAAELSNERAVQEAVDTLRGRKRRRSLARRVSGSSVVVLAIALLALVNSWMGGGRSSERPDHVAVRAERVGIDLDDVSAEDFRVRLRDEYGLELVLETSDALASLADHGMLEIRVGTRPWSMVFQSVDGGLGYLLTEKDLEAGGPVELQLAPNDGLLDSRTYGPYRIDLDLATEVRGLEERAFRSRREAAEAAPWLVGELHGGWRLDPNWNSTTGEIVEAVSVGLAPEALDARWVVPRGEPDASLRPELRVGAPVDRRAWRQEASALLAPFRRESVLHARLEYLDGTSGAVRRFDRWTSNFRELGSREFAEIRGGPLPKVWFADVLQIEHGRDEAPFTLEIREPTTGEVRPIEVLAQGARSTRLDQHYVQPGLKWGCDVPLGWDAVEAVLRTDDGSAIARAVFEDVRGPIDWTPVPGPADGGARLWAGVETGSFEGLELAFEVPVGTVRVLAGSGEPPRHEVNLRRDRMVTRWDGAWGAEPLAHPLQLVFQLEDGTEIGPLAYDLAGTIDLVRSHWLPQAHRNRTQLLVAFRKQGEVRRDSYLLQNLLGRANATEKARREWLAAERRGVLCLPSHGTDAGQGWQAVDRVRLGASPDALDVEVQVQHMPDQLVVAGRLSLGGLPLGSRLEPIELPVDTDPVFVRFVLADGSETEVVSLGVASLE